LTVTGHLPNGDPATVKLFWQVWDKE